MSLVCSGVHSLFRGDGDPEAATRRQVDLAVGWALIDRSQEALLVEDPRRVFDGNRCALKHYLEVGAIQADSLQDLAGKLHALFWPRPIRCADSVSDGQEFMSHRRPDRAPRLARQTHHLRPARQ